MLPPECIKQHKHLKFFGNLLHHTNLWAVNRKSIPGAFAIGLFVAWLPIPFQMVLAAALAIFINVNIPVAITLVWISNPITMPIMFYSAYQVGAKLLSHPIQHFTFETSWHWLQTSLFTIGPSFLLGCITLGTFCSFMGFILIKNIWLYSVSMQWTRRKK